MADDEKPFVRVDIGSPISLKTEIKAEIPKESSGRLLDALTDIIRPFSESRGLRADQIRLQREDVLIEIARKTREKLKIEGKIPQPVPNKFLIPFLEKASQEEIDSELIDKWSELLSSAAVEFNSSMVRFVSVLGEIGSREAKFLDRICRGCRTDKVMALLADAPDQFFDYNLREYLADILSVMVESQDENEKLFGRIVEDFEIPGAIFTTIWTNVGDYDQDNNPNFPINDDEDQIALSILESLGLVRETVVAAGDSESVLVAHCLALTRLGLKFVLACDNALRAAYELKVDV